MSEHLLFTAQQLSSVAMEALKTRSTLARIVARDMGQDLIPGRGATVTVKNPVHIDKARVYTKENRAAGDSITYSDLIEPYRSISISDQIYQAVRLPDDFTTFDVTNMSNQVVIPMAESVATELDAVVSRALQGVAEGLSAIDKAPKGQLSNAEGEKITAENRGNGAAGVGLGLQPAASSSPIRNAMLKAEDHSQVLPAIRAARQLLELRGVPKAGRYLVVGSGWGGALLSHQNLLKANEAGSTDLLREATIGKLYGFTIVEDPTIDPYEAYALDRQAITLVTRVPMAPQGAAFASTTSANGFTLRYLHDYDADRLQDRAVIDTFAGAEVLDGQRIVKLTADPGIEEPSTTAAAAGEGA